MTNNSAKKKILCNCKKDSNEQRNINSWKRDKCLDKILSHDVVIHFEVAYLK